MTKTHHIAIKTAAILWVNWALVQYLAGVIVLSADAAGGVAAIADAVDPAQLDAPCHQAVGGILKQHGWNLPWFGLVTLIGAGLIWRGNLTAIWVTALVGGMADLGYLLFVDLPGYVNFVPGTLMTLVSGSAIALSMWVWVGLRPSASAAPTEN